MSTDDDDLCDCDQDNEDEDEASYDHPIWLTELRGFIDYREREAEMLNELFAMHRTFAIEEWAISQRRFVFRFRDLDVELLHDLDQPLCVNANSSSMRRLYLDSMRAELREVLQLSLAEDARRTMSFGCMLLRITECAEGWLQSWRDSLAASLDITKKEAKAGGWDSATVSIQTALFDNKLGLNLMTANDTARHLLGRSITEICKDDEFEDLRILHVEPVFRDDLVMKFLRQKANMKEKLMQTSFERLSQIILRKPQVTFHGAPRYVVSSIVRYGFLIPGQKIGFTGKILDVERGSSFGVAIYSSPNASYASCYGRSSGEYTTGFTSPSSIPRFRLLVYATLMGRSIQVTREERRRQEGVANADADSHVSPNKMEYIVFDSAQIIPCYVLHVDYGAEYAKTGFEWSLQWRKEDHKRRQQNQHDNSRGQGKGYEMPADVVARKQALESAASKWFPYGYGPATGTRFEILEIGEVSDDEEEFGDYQAIRQQQWEETREKKRVESGGNWFDQYQSVRKSFKEVRFDEYDR
ncbi:hypothetical protein LTR78_005326 [Recurvomyces mirabilis]|uniref:Uncharacterized protein n=1 Tax=Recurvomyces mirabilis TaxID=574656 RepID=A0AAE1C1R0_9PEZI|nr:hypothetical protein LTR78_005326 [Recurvomyces mirabilis]KAK5157878.1 hypothetical protein LTS14_003800 [Recurvomyces mirabilis]